eukprot:s3918_g7.t1
MKLHTVGFCGVDDSVDLAELARLDQAFPGHWIEWGVLLRPDRQGEPRYASPALLKRLGMLARGEDPHLPGAKLRLAAHLCGQDCLRALAGDVGHISGLHALLGFGRAQLNPTKANLASDWQPEGAARGLRTLASALPSVEFILQMNDETQELFKSLFQSTEPAPPNLAVLLDASCGLGVAPGRWSAPPKGTSHFIRGGSQRCVGLDRHGVPHPQPVCSRCGLLRPDTDPTSCRTGPEVWMAAEEQLVDCVAQTYSCYCSLSSTYSCYCSLSRRL